MNYPYFQFSGGIFAALLVLVGLFFLFIFLPVSLVTEAFSRLGLTPIQGFLVFIAILLGRTVNLPIYTSERLVMVPRRRSVQFTMDSMGRALRVEEEPGNELKKQVVALNIGGCILPVLLSATFLIGLHVSGHAEGLFLWLPFATIIVALGCYAMSRPDPFTGLKVPLFMPGLMTFLSVYFFVPEPLRPVVAYVAGTLGTLIGGNLIPLLSPRVRSRIATPEISIGGAGTFGGVFIAGILAVLLA
ncbi:DUF1614 domain-containing protein [Pseudodesulfovibrio sp.]|uniref:DUF1614 domain-containing protein n=1 Tax=unclassified Pseudodesulfovibrio TaxID=2661612 RepID=UPI003B002A62